MTSASSGTKGLHVSSPPMFGLVEDNVYRCAYPTTSHGKFLQGLGLRTVLTLSLEALPMQSRRMLESQGARVVPLGGAAWGRFHNFDSDLIVEALRTVLDADSHPVLLTCATGELQTNAVVGALRRLQHWCMSSVHSEMVLYQTTMGPSHRTAILEAVEQFDPRDFFATHVQPRIAAQTAAMKAVRQHTFATRLGSFTLDSPSSTKPDRTGSEQPLAAVSAVSTPAASAAAGGSAYATPFDAGAVVDRRSPQSEVGTQVSEGLPRVVTMITNNAPPPVELPSAELLAPLPLWYINGVRHRLAALHALQARAEVDASNPGPPLAGAEAVVGSDTHAAGTLPTPAGSTMTLDSAFTKVGSGRQPRPAPPHEVHRFALLAPLISDPKGYSAESLVDSDDD